MAKYDDEILARLMDITYRHRNCVRECDDIISLCPKKLMSRGIDLYGMFFPDMEISKYITYKGRLTKNEKFKHYEYFFDEQGRLRLTKRYGDKVNDNRKLLNIIFYFYYDQCVEIVWYSLDENDVCITGFLDYENGKLAKFVEADNVTRHLRHNTTFDAYHEFLFNVDDEFVIRRGYSTFIGSKDKPWESVSKFRKH